jgi:hypothetical protein
MFFFCSNMERLERQAQNPGADLIDWMMRNARLRLAFAHGPPYPSSFDGVRGRPIAEIDEDFS